MLSESVGSLKMRVPLKEVILSIVVLVRGVAENSVALSSPPDDLALCAAEYNRAFLTFRVTVGLVLCPERSKRLDCPLPPPRRRGQNGSTVLLGEGVERAKRLDCTLRVKIGDLGLSKARHRSRADWRS